MSYWDMPSPERFYIGYTFSMLAYNTLLYTSGIEQSITLFFAVVLYVSLSLELYFYGAHFLPDLRRVAAALRIASLFIMAAQLTHKIVVLAVDEQLQLEQMQGGEVGGIASSSSYSRDGVSKRRTAQAFVTGLNGMFYAARCLQIRDLSHRV